MITVVVIVGILAALALPMYNRVVDGGRDKSALATVASILRGAQTLHAQGADWGEAVDGAAEDTAYYGKSDDNNSDDDNSCGPKGASQVAHWQAADNTDSLPDPLPGCIVFYDEVSYSETSNGVVLALRSDTGQICVGAADRIQVVAARCEPAVADGTPYAVTRMVAEVGTSGTPEGGGSGPVTTVLQPGPFTLTSEVSGNQPVLSWTASGAATSYRVERASSSTFSDAVVLVASTTTRTYTDTSAGYGVSHYRVSALGVAGSDPSVQTTSVAVSAPAPGAPSAPVVGTVTASSIAVTWGGVSGASSYAVTYQKAGGAALLLDTTGTAATLTGLDAGSEYTITVAARNSSGASAPSPTTTGTTRLAAPTVAATAAPDAVSITVTGANVPAATGYTFYYKKAADATYLSVASATNNKAFTSLAENTAYSFYVVATNSVATSPESAVVTATTTGTPAKPVQLRALNASASSGRIVWTSVAGATGYDVQRSTTGSGGWTSIYHGPATDAGVAGWMMYENTGLTANMSYYYRVRAYNAYTAGVYTTDAPTDKSNIARTMTGTGPQGTYDEIVNLGGNKFAVRGWLLSQPSGTAGKYIVITVDGNSRADYSRGLNPNLVGAVGGDSTVRLDVMGAYPGYGENTGFNSVVSGITAGAHTVCITAANATTAISLGCRTVTVTN